MAQQPQPQTYGTNPDTEIDPRDRDWEPPTPPSTEPTTPPPPIVEPPSFPGGDEES